MYLGLKCNATLKQHYLGTEPINVFYRFLYYFALFLFYDVLCEYKSLPDPELPKGHGAGCSNVQRVYVMGHGDARGVIAVSNRAGRQSITF